MEEFAQAPVATCIFLITIATSLFAFSNENIYGKFMLHPYSVSRGSRIYTIITSGLIHRDWMHLLMNMLSYYFFAFPLERTFVAASHWGHIQFGLLYIVGLILSDASSILKHKNDFWYNSLGASGAVCAVIFSYILFYPLTMMIILPIPIPIPALLYGLLFLGYCMYASKYSRDSINHDAHFLGAIVGVVITIILYPPIISHFFTQLTG